MNNDNIEYMNTETVQLFLNTIPSILHDARKYALLIRGFTELLQREQVGILNDQQKEMTDEVIRRAKMLFHVLDQALLLSSIDMYPQPPEPSICHVDDTIREAIAITMRVNAPKSETIQIEQKTGSLSIFADKDDMLRMLLQVLDNAVKYTPIQGIITITTTAHEGIVMIAIRDSGAGIPQEHHPYLFQRLSARYQQLPYELSSAGVGLAIADAFAKRNNSRIELVETSEKGSVFAIYIPQAPPEAPHLSAPEYARS